VLQGPNRRGASGRPGAYDLNLSHSSQLIDSRPGSRRTAVYTCCRTAIL
jgi:hypothetical protein